jgi:hypothetical protein
MPGFASAGEDDLQLLASGPQFQPLIAAIVGVSAGLIGVTN